MDEVIPEVENWLSLKWYLPGVLSNFSWQYKYLLWAIPIIILVLVLKWLLGQRLSPKLPVALKESANKFDISSLFRFIPIILLLLVLVNIILALSRPQKSNEKVDRWTEGIDIMLLVDISESMKLMDFDPNRLEAAKNVAREFINGRFQDRVGIVIFSGDAYSLAPLTTDYELLHSYINEIDFSKIESRGTAIGSALAVATNRMSESDSQSKVAILLSDGENTAGNIDPLTAAKLAHAHDIKIYSIAIGKEGRVPMGRGPFGQMRYTENNLDESTLRQIAEIGEGSFYRATSNQTLQQIFEIIDQYEKAEIKETYYKDTTDYYPVYLNWAIVFLILWLLTKSTFMVNVLQD